MIVKRINKRTKEESYFCGYDMDQQDFCSWVNVKAGAKSLKEEIAKALVNFILINRKDNFYRFEII